MVWCREYVEVYLHSYRQHQISVQSVPRFCRLTPGECPAVPIEWVLGRTQSRSGPFGGEIIASARNRTLGGQSVKH
jgi:hypothetical protein